jgi:hypothetical protein
MRYLFLMVWVLAVQASHAYKIYYPDSLVIPEFKATEVDLSTYRLVPVSLNNKGKGDALPVYIQLSATFGLSQTTVSNLSDALQADRRFSYGAGVDVVFADGFTGRMPTGIYYQSSGVSIAELHYIKVPLQYQFYVDGVKRLFLGGGGYGGYLVGSKQTSTAFNLDNLKSTDAGVLASTGYWLTLNKYDFTARLIFQFTAQWGLVDIDPSTGSNLDKNRMYCLSVTYTPFAGRSNRLPRFGPVIKNQ